MAQKSRFSQLLSAINSVAGATRGLTSDLDKKVLPGFFLHLRRQEVDVVKQEKISFGLADGDLETQLRTIIGRFGDEDAVMDRSLRQVLGWDDDQKVEDLPGDLTRLAEAARVTDPNDPQYAVLRDLKNPHKPKDVDPRDKKYRLFDAIMLGIFVRYWMVALKALDFRNKVIFGISFSVKEGMLSREDITKQMGELGVWGDGMTKYVEYPDKLEDGTDNPETEVAINEIVDLLENTGPAYLSRSYKFKQRVIVRENRIRQVFEAMKRLGINMPIPLGGEIVAKILLHQDLSDTERLQYARTMQQEAYKRFLIHLFTWTEKAKQGKGWGEPPQLIWMGFEAIWGGVNYNQIKSDVLHALLDVADHFTLIKERERKASRGDYGPKDARQLLGKGMFSHLPDEVDQPANWATLSQADKDLFKVWNPTRLEREADLLKDADLFQGSKIKFLYVNGLPLPTNMFVNWITDGAGIGWHINPAEFQRQILDWSKLANWRDLNAQFQRATIIGTFDPSDPKAQLGEVRKAYIEGEIPIEAVNDKDPEVLTQHHEHMSAHQEIFEQALPGHLEEIFGDLAREF